MKTRKINITIEIPDNDMIQFNLEKLLYNVIGEEKIIDLTVFPNTDHLKDNQMFKQLLSEKKSNKKILDRFINNNREL